MAMTKSKQYEYLSAHATLLKQNIGHQGPLAYARVGELGVVLGLDQSPCEAFESFPPDLAIVPQRPSSRMRE